MSNLIFFILGVVVGGAGVWVFFKDRSFGRVKDGPLPEQKPVINPAQVEAKEKGLERIYELVKEKGEVTNNDVERALGVSDARPRPATWKSSSDRANWFR